MNAERMVRLEEDLRLDWEQGLQDALLGHDALVTLFNWIYIWGHWPVIITAGIVLYRTRPERYLVLRNAMLLSGAIGFLFFALLPVAPPRLFDPALLDTVTQQSEAYRALQPPGLTNQYAAFPSLHFGWNLLLGIVVWTATTNPLLRLLSVLGPAAMGLAVVVTANHYVLDLVGGAAIVLFSLWVAERRQAPLLASLCRVTFVVAHRAGNELARLRDAERLGVASSRRTSASGAADSRCAT